MSPSLSFWAQLRLCRPSLSSSSTQSNGHGPARPTDSCQRLGHSQIARASGDSVGLRNVRLYDRDPLRQCSRHAHCCSRCANNFTSVLSTREPRLQNTFQRLCSPASDVAGLTSLLSTLALSLPLSETNGATDIRAILLPLLAFTIIYYSLNTWLITVAISLERRLSPLKVWKDNFIWIALNYFGGASVAALLVSYTKDVDYSYLLIIVPLIFVLYFTFKTSMGRVEDSNRHLSQLNTLYMSTIETLAMAIDAKDQITHGHIRRVQFYAVGLAKAMGVRDEAQIRAIEAAALLHDMGKLAVPEYILNKPGPLTAAEFDKMKLHASVGADILSAIDFPYPVVPIVRHHHENWNGTGYPDRLAGSEIPIGARIYRLLTASTRSRPTGHTDPGCLTRRPYGFFSERRGTMYDPLVVDAFIRGHESLKPFAEGDSRLPLMRAITGAAALNAPTSEPRAARLEEIAAQQRRNAYSV